MRWSTEPTGESAAVKFSRLPAGGVARQGGKLIALRTEHDIPPLHHALRRGLQQNTEDLTGQVLSADQGMVAASRQDGGVGDEFLIAEAPGFL